MQVYKIECELHLKYNLQWSYVSRRNTSNYRKVFSLSKGYIESFQWKVLVCSLHTINIVWCLYPKYSSWWRCCVAHYALPGKRKHVGYRVIFILFGSCIRVVVLQNIFFSQFSSYFIYQQIKNHRSNSRKKSRHLIWKAKLRLVFICFYKCMG